MEGGDVGLGSENADKIFRSQSFCVDINLLEQLRTVVVVDQSAVLHLLYMRALSSQYLCTSHGPCVGHLVQLENTTKRNENTTDSSLNNNHEMK